MTEIEICRLQFEKLRCVTFPIQNSFVLQKINMILYIKTKNPITKVMIQNVCNLFKNQQECVMYCGGVRFQTTKTRENIFNLKSRYEGGQTNFHTLENLWSRLS